MFARIKNFFHQETAMRMARGYREGHRYAASALLSGVAPAQVLQNMAVDSVDMADDYFASVARGATTAITQFQELIHGR